MLNKTVRRAKDKEDIYKKLTNDSEGPFITLRDVFITAACLGFLSNKKEKIEAVGETFKLQVFEEKNYQTIINLIALLDTNDINVLSNNEEAWNKKITIIEEYANAGIKILEQKLLLTPGDPLNNYIDLIIRFNSHKEGLNSLIEVFNI